MKCFNHTEQDAVGTCSQCGKAGCRECVEDVGGALLCASCLDVYQQAHAQEQQQIAQDRQAIMDKARMRIWVSWAVALGGIVAGFFIWQNQRDPDKLPLIIFAPWAAYCFWGMYWGVPLVYRWVRKLMSNFGFSMEFSLAAWVIVISGFCSCLWMVAAFYGCLGGGIYEYYKLNKIAKGDF